VSRDRETVAEIACLTLLLGYLVWVPMPFGSASDAALTPFVVPPLVLCALTAALASRQATARLTRQGRLWLAGFALSIAYAALQLVPLPALLLRLLSPEAARMWAAADRVASLAGVPAHVHPLTIDPSDTAVQLFRVAAYGATFVTAMLVVRTGRRRAALLIVLASLAIFEAVYAFRQAALGRYEIWGWNNKLIFDRATGTFVNPNHFAHYVAIILPMAVMICAIAWHTAAAPETPAGRRLVMMIEHRFLLFGFGALASLVCVAAILVSQSRGAMVATVCGFAITGAMASGRRHAVLRGGLIAFVVLAVFVVVFFLLGRTSESKHLEEQETSTLIGRRSALVAAFHIWREFPLFGSGAGTFEELAPREQGSEDWRIANHAHDDYAEALATTGATGFVLAFVPLMGGLAALARAAFGRRAATHSNWRRRAFCAAALTSVAIAMIHALVDFNFYIPANPATLAAIAGAAAGIRDPQH
jgi:O-antigen ligase